MAAGASRQYTAIFAIGGKLLGSFKGVMNAAQARLQRLQTASAGLQTGFKKLIGLAGTFAAAFAGFGAGKILSSMFEGASEEAANFEKTQKSIQFLLLKNNKIMAAGHGDMQKSLAFAKQQQELVTAHNEALGEQGVLSEKIFEALSKQLALMGVPPKQIMHSVGAMGDLLVAINNVSASEEDATNLARALGKAIMSNQAPTRQLQKLGIFLPKDWSKQFTTYQARLDDLIKRIKFAKGANLSEALTPLGRIQKFQNHLEKMRRSIGEQIIPIQAKLADMWGKALPEMRPAIIFLFRGLLRVMQLVSQLVIKYLIPAFKRLQAMWATQTPQQQKRWLMIALAIAGVAAALVALGAVALPVIAAIVAALGSPITGVIASVVASIVGMAVFWKVAGATIMRVASSVWEFLKAGWQDVIDVLMSIWALIEPDISAIWQDIKTITIVFWEWLKLATHEAINIIIATWRLISPIVQPIFDKIMSAWALIKKAFESAKPVIIGVIKEIGKVLIDWMLEPLKQFRWVFDKVASAVNAFRPGGGVAQAGAAAASVAPAAAAAKSLQNIPPAADAAASLPIDIPPADMTRSADDLAAQDAAAKAVGGRSGVEAAARAKKLQGFAAGAIVHTPSIAAVAERSPEAIIPLTRGRRSLSLLDYANKTLGMGAQTTHVSFSPSIVINGNATESEQRAMDSRLRDAVSDFIKRFKQAQGQERRLSYEGGYL